MNTKIGQVLEYIKNNEGVTKKDIFDNVAVSEGTLKVYLHRLLNKGNIEIVKGLYHYISDREVVDRIINADLTKNDYLKSFLDAVVEHIKEYDDPRITLEFIREGRQIIKELK